MKKENILLILWIIFGFIFITGIDSILYFIIHLIYIGLAELGISYKIMTIVVPITTLILYLFTALILTNRIKIKSKTSGIYLTEFPKKLIILLGVISFALPPITNKLSGLYTENISENSNVGMSEFLTFYGWFHTSFGVSQLLILGILVIISLVKLRNLNDH